VLDGAQDRPLLWPSSGTVTGLHGAWAACFQLRAVACQIISSMWLCHTTRAVREVLCYRTSKWLCNRTTSLELCHSSQALPQKQ
jgi:hypothetical protein